jgi:transcriptional regulator with XRE-family HTH domain
VAVTRASRFLASARRRAGLSQRALAERARIPQATVSRIERGLTDPHLDTLDRLLRACGAELEVLPRLGDGVERGHIRALLALSPAERLASVPAEAAALGAIDGVARRAGAVPRLRS